MDIAFIDEQGRLFGVVNVIDALAVLMVLAVVIAGVALVLQPEPEPAEPNYDTTTATLDLGTQPDYLVSAISEGDTYSPNGNSKLTVTDVYLAPQGAKTRVSLKVRLRGKAADSTISYAGGPPRLGRSLAIQTSTYQVKGVIRDVGGGPTFDLGNTQVLLTNTIDAAQAATMDVGDTYRVGGQSVGTIESLTVFGTDDPTQKRVYVGLSLQTHTDGSLPKFGPTPVRDGAIIPFKTSDYEFNGTVLRVGTTERPGTQTTRTVTLRLEDVSGNLANSLHAGMTETGAGSTIAKLTEVNTQPATVVLVSNDGHIYQRDHPTKKDVTLRAELSVRQTTAGLTFKGQPIQQGSTVVLDLGTVTIRATVAGL